MPRHFDSRRILTGLAFLLTLPALADTFVLPPPDFDLVGSVGSDRSVYEDTLLDIARRHNVGYEEIIRANPGVDPWIPGDGTEITIPGRFILPPVPRKGIVVNLPEMRIYYYPEPGAGKEPVVITHPVSVGRMDWQTPLGLAKVMTKVKDPSWYPPDSVREEHAADGDILPKIVPPGPANPLGKFAMRLSIPGYLIHGTNQPSGVGMRVTHGCIRMFPEDIEQMFQDVPVGTSVRLINMPSKIGWSMDSLFLEVHPPLEEDTEHQEKNLTVITELLVAATRERSVPVDWAAAREIYEKAEGIPLLMSVSDSNLVAAAETGDQ